MAENLIEQAKKKLRSAKSKGPSPAPQTFYGNLPPAKPRQEQVFQVRIPSAVTGVRG